MATNRSIKDESDGIAALFVMLFAVTIGLGWRLTTTLRTQAEQASKMNELTRKLETIEGQQKKMSMMREASSRVGAKLFN